MVCPPVRLIIHSLKLVDNLFVRADKPYSISHVDNTEELQWLKHLGTMKICSRQGQFEIMSVIHSAKSGGIKGIHFRFSII